MVGGRGAGVLPEGGVPALNVHYFHDMLKHVAGVEVVLSVAAGKPYTSAWVARTDEEPGALHLVMPVRT